MFYTNKHQVFTPVHFMNGDRACAEGAIRAGCTFFAGYPITPATEIAERMSRRLPSLGGTYIQMEDEIASMNAVLGASWGGAKAMTATSGPGFTLMMENLGLGMITETPCVIVDVQRGGPSTGLPTMVGQADIMQCKWGSHGDYEVIALAPSSPQECYDLAIKAFEYSEIYRMPVFIMMDETVGHMSERVIYPDPQTIKPTPRKYTTLPPEEYLPYRVTEDDLVPAMAPINKGYHIHMTGLTHNEKGYPEINVKAQANMMNHLIGKVRNNVDKIIMLEEKYIDDADIVIVSFGISARIADYPLEQARKEGLKVGLLRLVTVWPFPENYIDTLASKIKAFIVPEINMGQISLEVERCAHGKTNVIPVTHQGGGLHTPQQLLEVIRRASK